jgi:hypothetical protein
MVGPAARGGCPVLQVRLWRVANAGGWEDLTVVAPKQPLVLAPHSLGQAGTRASPST